MKKENLLIGIFVCVGMIVCMLMAWAVYGQEVSVNIGVVEGSIHEHTFFKSTMQIDGSIYEDGYKSSFRAPLANMTFSKTFNEAGVKTAITGISEGFITEKEIISTTQIYDQSCCAAAAGSKFIGSGIEYKSNASPGGIGPCCGVNFTGDVPQSEGRLTFESIYMHIGEVTIEPEEEGGTPTTTFEDTIHRSEITVSGIQNNLSFMVVAPPCSPADETPGDPLLPEFKLCVDPPSGLLPWPHAVE